MKFTINGITVEGTPQELAQFIGYVEQKNAGTDNSAPKTPQQPTRNPFAEANTDRDFNYRVAVDLGKLHLTRRMVGGALYTPLMDKIEFTTNGRTVVALIKHRRSGRVWARGTAKCAPGDRFNIGVGRVIALHRALGLPVPGLYLNAPKAG